MTRSGGSQQYSCEPCSTHCQKLSNIVAQHAAARRRKSVVSLRPVRSYPDGIRLEPLVAEGCREQGIRATAAAKASAEGAALAVLP
jgi:hypothetical protein